MNELRKDIENKNKRFTEEPLGDIILEYDEMVEELRTRLNILSTSLFLLHDSSNLENPKINRYIEKINLEMERIRQIVSHHPRRTK